MLSQGFEVCSEFPKYNFINTYDGRVTVENNKKTMSRYVFPVCFFMQIEISKLIIVIHIHLKEDNTTCKVSQHSLDFATDHVEYLFDTSVS